MLKYKLEGNELFKKGKYKEAIDKYRYGQVGRHLTGGI